MKAYLAIKYHSDGANRARIERVCAALDSAGIETMCVVRDLERWGAIRFEPDDLMRRSFALLDSCDLLVVELTEKGVGVGIEAGYAHAKAIPIVAVAETGAEISDTLRGISREVLIYQTSAELAEFCARLSNYFKKAKISSATTSAARTGAL